MWLLLGVALAVASWFLWQRWEIRSLKQEVRSLGLPTTREELDRFYVVPAGALDNSANWNPPLSSIPEDVKETATKELQPFVCDPTRIPRPGEPWDLQSQAVAFLDAYGAELKALHDAGAIGGQTRLPVDYKIEYEGFNGHIRSAFRLLHFEAVVAAYQRDATRCREAQKTAVGLYLAIQGQPDHMSFLIANSALLNISVILEWLLVESQWSDAELASLQHKLCSIDYKEQVKLAIAGEAVCDLGIYREFYPMATGAEIEVLRWSLSARHALDRDWPQVLTQFQKIEDRLTAASESRFRFTTVYFDVDAPYRDHFATSGARAAARSLLVNAGLAVQRFHLRHGRYPATLAEVDADLFERIADGTIPLTDPFDGHPLRYLVQPNRCLIYSIAEDKIDNAGDVDYSENRDGNPKDVGFSVRH